VSQFRFSRLAETDLLNIASFTIQNWGQTQADRYLDDLEACCRQLADTPGLGRSCDNVRPGLHRMECGRHVILYRQEKGGILISRILHQRMLPEKHMDDDTDNES